MIKRLQSRVFIGEWSSRQEKIVLYKESRYTYKVFNTKVYNPNRYISWLSRQRIRKKAILISRITLYFRKFSKEFVGYFLTWLSLFSWSYDQRFWSFDSQRPAFDVTQKGRGPFLHSMNGPFGWGDAILLSGKHCLLFFD